MKKSIALLLATLFFVSCGDDTTTQTVKVEGKYMLEIPAHMKKTKGLNDDASLEYQNALKELYVVVIDESKAALEQALDDNGLYDSYTADLNGYTALATDNIRAAMELDTLPKTVDTKINGLQAKVLSLEGKLDDMPAIYYKFAFAEGRNRYYQIIVWTLADSKEKHDEAMKAMIESFRETDRSKIQ